MKKPQRSVPMAIFASVAVLLLVSTTVLTAQQSEQNKKNTHPAPAEHQQSQQPHQQETPPQHQQHQNQAPPQQQNQPQVHQHQPPPPERQTPPPNESHHFGGQAPQTQQPDRGHQFGNQSQPPQQDRGHQFGSQPQQPQPNQGQRFGHPSDTQQHNGYTPRPGVRMETGPGNREIYHSPTGGQVHMDHGRVLEVHTAGGAVIHHGPEGYRHVEMVRPGGRTVVINNYGGGYVQKTVFVSNHSFVQRTYVVNGVVSTRVYRPFVFGGVTLALYTPGSYYRPAFYAYAYNPWARPIYYNSWGWVGTPWFGFYAGYFTPAPSYSSPAGWLTDYIIAAVLQDAYQQRREANLSMSDGYYSGHPGLTPDVREAIALEVGRQLRQEEAEARMGGAGTAMNPFTGGTHIFVADGTVEGVAGGQACAITGGDVLEMRGAPAFGANVAPVLVRASKRGGCPRGAVVMVAVQDLAEMQNHMREVMDRGLAELQARHGQGGMPALSAEVAAPAQPVSWASEIRPDVGVQNEISQVSNDANRAEQETLNSTVQGGNPEPVANEGAAAPQIGIGSSIEDVVAAWGQPLRTADLGGKKIYIYKDVKVTFQDGRVIDVQ